MVYEGGEIVPGDDMAGSEARWWLLDELVNEVDLYFHDSIKLWLLRRSVDLYRLWKDEGERPLQPLLD
jgi:hypothetical protein